MATAPVSKMASELLMEVFSYFQYPYRIGESWGYERKEIHAVTLVSKYWNEVASPMSWDRIYICPGRKIMETFKQQQQLKHNCGGFVKHMNISVWGILKEDQDMLPMIVVTFPNVISLSLHQFNDIALDMNLL